MTGDEATLDLTVNTLILSLYQHIQDLHLKKIDAEGYDSQTQISYMLLFLFIGKLPLGFSTLCFPRLSAAAVLFLPILLLYFCYLPHPTAS